MTTRRKPVIVALCTILTAAMIVVLLAVFGEQFKTAVQAQANNNDGEPEMTHHEIIYYAHGNLDENDNIPQKDGDMYFGWNRYRGANEAVANNEADSVVNWIATKDGEGDFFTSLEHDPALTAAVALYLDQLELTGNDPILAPEANLLVGERADAAHKRFLENESDWDTAITRIKAILCGQDVVIEVKELNNYTSAMYMIPQQLDGDKPCVVVRNTSHAGGHFVVFRVKLKDGKIVNVRFRLECGYQPIDVPNWTPPDKPDPEPPTPTPPELEPKDPQDDPQNRPDADQYDFWSPDHENHDPDTTVTDEPQSPDGDYVAPSRPEDTVMPPSEQDASSGTDSGSRTVDEDNGTTEQHDGQNYDVEAGDGQDHSDLTDTADPSNPNKPDVDPALRDDGVNETPVTDFE